MRRAIVPLLLIFVAAYGCERKEPEPAPVTAAGEEGAPTAAAPAAAGPTPPGYTNYPYGNPPPEIVPELWPQPDFRVSLRRTGVTEDIGMLRRTPAGTLEILYGEGWLPYGAAGHVGNARMFYWAGPGWSAGPGAHNLHFEAQNWYNLLSGRDPVRWPPRVQIAARRPASAGESPLERVDYDRALFCQVASENGAAGLCGVPGGGTSAATLVPAAVEFQLTPGQTGRFAQAVRVEVPGSGQRWTRTPSAQQPAPGLALSAAPAGRTGSGTLDLTLDVAGGVPVGTYKGSVTINTTGSQKTPLPVTVKVGTIIPPAECKTVFKCTPVAAGGVKCESTLSKECCQPPPPAGACEAVSTCTPLPTGGVRCEATLSRGCCQAAP